MRTPQRAVAVAVTAVGLLGGTMTAAGAAPPADGDCPRSFSKYDVEDTVKWLVEKGYPDDAEYTAEEWAAGGFDALNANHDEFMCIKRPLNPGVGQPAWLYIMIDNHVGGPSR